jgi:hypothetical protein
MTEVALWLMRYHSPDYLLCDDEAEAASTALAIEDQGSGVPLGVQFPDGSTIKVDEWPVYAAAKQRQREAERQERANWQAAPRPPMREARDPFRGQPVRIELEEPAWLGA